MPSVTPVPLIVAPGASAPEATAVTTSVVPEMAPVMPDDAMPDGQKEPAGQAEHALELGREKKPAGHGSGALEPVGQKKPAGQADCVLTAVEADGQNQFAVHG